jgi:hypothetical protein
MEPLASFRLVRQQVFEVRCDRGNRADRRGIEEAAPSHQQPERDCPGRVLPGIVTGMAVRNAIGSHMQDRAYGKRQKRRLRRRPRRCPARGVKGNNQREAHGMQRAGRGGCSSSLLVDARVSLVGLVLFGEYLYDELKLSGDERGPDASDDSGAAAYLDSVTDLEGPLVREVPGRNDLLAAAELIAIPSRSHQLGTIRTDWTGHVATRSRASQYGSMTRPARAMRAGCWSRPRRSRSRRTCVIGCQLAPASTVLVRGGIRSLQRTPARASRRGRPGP